MSRSQLVRLAGVIGAAGAVVQIAYGVIALVVGYPAIVETRGYEAIWGVAIIGMAAGAIAWAAADFARPRRAAVIGAGLVAVGGFVRLAVSVLLIADPNAAADGAIVASMLLMFGGLAVLGVATVRAHILGGVDRLLPFVVLLAGFVAASFYTPATAVHFPLLGLLWGPTWLYLATRAIGATPALVAATRSVGARPRSRPRRPPET
ncbi:hypothetical protein OG394_12165 [Kribbella sp. NBC_01245]|uniref:hypothetical protein n=1 Tax=Kribbella sp. NBC_01245 TaxID=2903578 RepID=UPI002E27E3C6|nr:hypothetical protein [Kribbella sp. NBC_01245]